MECKNVIKIEGVWYVIDGVEAMVARYQNHKYTGHITIPSEVKYMKQVYPVLTPKHLLDVRFCVRW